MVESVQFHRHSDQSDCLKWRQGCPRNLPCESNAARFEYIEVFYNNERIHSSIQYCTPSDFEHHYYVNAAK
ncbi:IS3 family transposase [Paenibacillus sp. MZ04-78.2]|uniref:IS3 family transposase n=1 Tax=Paenibacillus sp. MZ04-78.2 TaxID=2962034 RepID=UPI0035CBDAB0